MDDPRVTVIVEAMARARYERTQAALSPDKQLPDWDALPDYMKAKTRQDAEADLRAALTALPGVVVTEVPGAVPAQIYTLGGNSAASYNAGHADGHNACRAEMLAKAVRL